MGNNVDFKKGFEEGFKEGEKRIGVSGLSRNQSEIVLSLVQRDFLKTKKAEPKRQLELIIRNFDYHIRRVWGINTYTYKRKKV